MSLLDLLGGLLRPPVCLGCGRPEAWPCCAACLPPDPASPGPWRLAAVPDLALWALGTYGGAMREAVLAGKLGAQPAALAALGRRLGAALAAAGAGADLVTWIAAGRARGLPRDHAHRIAAAVAASLDLPAVGLLGAATGADLGRRRGSGRPGAAPPGRPDTERGTRETWWRAVFPQLNAANCVVETARTRCRIRPIRPVL